MRDLDHPDLYHLCGVINRDIPGFELRYKDKSSLMKILGFLLAPFNPSFMDSYVTTLGKKVYFPSYKHFDSDPGRSFRILAHEYVHLCDSKSNTFFGLTYLLPQVLALLPLTAFAVVSFPYSWLALLPVVWYVLACFAFRQSIVLFWGVLCSGLLITLGLAWLLTGWGAIILASVFLFLAPWPSPWRTKWELRGYGMNVAIAFWLYGHLAPRHRNHITTQFTGPSYFYMCRDRGKIQAALESYHNLAGAGILQGRHPYDRVFKTIHRK